MILQSVDSTYRNVIQNCFFASSAYKIHTQRYGIRDITLFVQLLAQLFAIKSMNKSLITERFDLVVNMSFQIADNVPEVIIPNIFQAAILMRSLPPDYDTILEILTNN